MGTRGFAWLGLLGLLLVGCANGQEADEVDDPPEAVGVEEDTDTDDIAEESDEVGQAEDDPDLSTLGGMWRMTVEDVRVTMATGDYSDADSEPGSSGGTLGTAQMQCSASDNSCVVMPGGDEPIFETYRLRLVDGVPVLENAEFDQPAGHPMPWQDGCDWPSVDEAGIVSFDGPDTWRFTSASHSGEGENCLQIVYEVVVTRVD